MASAFWNNIAFSCLGPQEQKVLDIFDMGLGWEVWTQLELALGCKKEYTSGRMASSLDSWTFDREKQVYKGTALKCDFLSSFKANTLGPKEHHHFVELKCLRKNKLSDFIAAVRKDIEKVKAAVPRDDWTQNADYVGGWVMAITVNPNFSPEIGDRMEKLAADEGISWIDRRGFPVTDVHTHLNTGNSRITVWTWTHTFIRDGKPT